MRNSILKSYFKKFIRNEAFLSIIIVFVLAIGIIGTSYALYMDVDTDVNYQLVEVGDLSVGFDNGDSTFTLNYLTPTDDDIATNKIESDIAKEISTKNFFSFYIYNNGNYTANYDIKLVPQEGSISGEYLRFQVCKDSIENCKDIKTLSEANNNIIYTDELSPNRSDDQTNPSAYYFLRVWVKNDYVPNADDKVILKVEINAKNASGYLDNDNTLAGKLLSDERVKINNDIPDFSVTETEEKGLYKTEDDYGTSYYYRGKQPYNYVKFAGFTWRVVRINGDGSIRLTLNGTLSTTKREGLSVYAGENSYFNELADDNAYVGYMYGEFEGNSTSYEEAHSNVVDSTIKKEVDKFYETYIENEEQGYHYGKYLADTMFCGEKALNTNCFGKTNCYSYRNHLKNETPTLFCAKNHTNNYSRYTVEEYTTSTGVETNGNLKYPIALLNADELRFAGAIFGNISYSNYLDNGYGWTMSAHGAEYNPYPTTFFALALISFNSSSYPLWTNSVNNQKGGVRPVINLRADVLWASGDGTSITPYEIK